MTDLNNVIIIGRLTKDVEINYTKTGFPIGQFSIAVNKSEKQKDGSYKDYTSFFECKTLGKQAETIQKYFEKGNKILIQGSVKQERWTGQENKTFSKIIIEVNNFTFMDHKSNTGAVNQQADKMIEEATKAFEGTSFINDPWGDEGQF